MWIIVKRERKAHVVRPDSGSELLETGCDRGYPPKQVAEASNTAPPVKVRCRGCDTYYCQHLRLFTDTNGAADNLPRKE